MSAATKTPTRDAFPGTEASFGLSCVRVVIRPDDDTGSGQLLFEVSCLLGNALAAFEAIADGADGDVPELHFAGLYLLRQAKAALSVAQGGAV